MKHEMTSFTRREYLKGLPGMQQVNSKHAGVEAGPGHFQELFIVDKPGGAHTTEMRQRAGKRNSGTREHKGYKGLLERAGAPLS